MFAEVLLTQRIIKTLTYKVPKELEKDIKIGQAIEIPLRSSTTTGYVLRFKDYISGNTSYEIKEIVSLKASGSFFDSKTVELMEWMSSYYVIPLYKLLTSVLPVGAKTIKKTDKFFEDIEIKNDNLQRVTKLNSSQAHIFNEIVNKNEDHHLIHGVTGSGKTQIYVHILNYYANKGQSSILLVPEIGLSFQLYKEIKECVFENVFLLHSGLTSKERRETWAKIVKCKNSVVVGTRSAIFAPVQNLGCIILDEEQDSAYKQEQTPRYNARAIAFKRAKINKAKLILGSATPSINTMYQAKGNYKIHNLMSRYNNVQMPTVEVINLKEHSNYPRSLISTKLQKAIHETMQKKEQVIILYNQRGVSKFVRCEDCGEVIICPHCSISLTLHKQSNMKCHYCGHSDEMPAECPDCKSKKLKKIGKGIQALEKELNSLFGYARVRRLDSDVSSAKNYLSETLQSVRNNEVDILLGTQMVAKGHHFPNVTTVAVIDADTSLFIPDIYSNERTFNLLVQVIGRAGRENKQGRVFVQTFHPDHYSIKNGVSQNYAAFYRKELEYRKEFDLPPFNRMIRVYVENDNEQIAEKDMEYLYSQLKAVNEKLEITEPFPAMLYKIKGRYRWNILIKHPKDLNPVELKKVLFQLYFDRSINSRIYVDVDPISYM